MNKARSGLPIALALLAALFVFSAAIGIAEEPPDEAIAAIRSAVTLDEQLARLHAFSLVCGARFETGGWDVDLDFEPAEDIPEGILPAAEDALEADKMPDALQNARFIVIFDEYDTTGSLDRRFIPGAFYIRLPEANRAASLEDADAVLYVTHTYDQRGDYTGKAYNRVYRLYAAPLDGSGVYLLSRLITKPPQSGMGALAGERLSQEALWRLYGSLFYRTELTVPYPEQEGEATFRVTGSGCCLIRLDGSFPGRYEVPAEVEGIPVTGIEFIRNSTVQELVLPEGVTYISGNDAISCVNLTAIHFPSTLRRITGRDVFGHTQLKSLTFNEGLEEIGDDVIPGGEKLREVNFPSTLRTLGSGNLRYGLMGTWAALPEGVTAVHDQFLPSTRRVECVFLPASIGSISGNVLNSVNSTRVYAPEGSFAARWAVEKGKPYIPCAGADLMPRPEITADGDYTYIVVEGEAMLISYTGEAEEVIVPEALGGCPVTVIKQGAFKGLANLKTLVFPDTIRMLELYAVTDCENLEGIYVPCSPASVHFSFMSAHSCGGCKVYAPADSSIAAIPEIYGLPFVAWEP